MFSLFLFKKHLKGVTGDALGAGIQIVEMMVYLSFVFHYTVL